MNLNETKIYIGNIIAVIRADGSISKKEEDAIELIYAETKTKKSLIKEAEKLAEGQDYKVEPAGRFSDQIRNLEDMFFVALIDGELTNSEKSIIVSFAKQLGITQDQFKSILSDSQSRIDSLSNTKRCPNCQINISSTAKFCPECGSPIKDIDQCKSMKLDFDYPNEGISIEFAESTSANFESALKCAMKSQDFQEILRSKKRWYLATWPKSQILFVIDLVENLKGLRNRKVYVDGEEIAWDEMFGFLWCFQQRKSAYRPEEYCFGTDERMINIWGCKQLRMDWTDWAEWFTYGKFIKKDVFEFDKERIRHELKTNMHRVRFCPYLRKSLIENILQLLPSKVNISKKEGWYYKENYDETPNSIKIVVKEKDGGYTSTYDFYSDGVTPVGFKVAKEILQKAFAQCGINEINHNSIFR